MTVPEQQILSLLLNRLRHCDVVFVSLVCSGLMAENFEASFPALPCPEVEPDCSVPMAQELKTARLEPKTKQMAFLKDEMTLKSTGPLALYGMNPYMVDEP